jgi:mediator of RNA polymerase II transcription subunit 12
MFSPSSVTLLTALELSTLSYRDQLARLISIADDLSLPFCKLEIQHLLSSESGLSIEHGNKDNLASALFDAVTHAVDSNNLVWLELVQGLDSDMLLKVSPLMQTYTFKALTVLDTPIR